MTINRYNYLEFFLLYTDNELGAAERKEVEEFVQQHTDLGEELLIMEQLILKPDNDIVFEDKQSLFHFNNEDELINAGNFEEFVILYTDEELNETEKNRFTQYLAAHPHLQRQLEQVRSLKLVADTSIQFPDKEILYRHEKEHRPVIFTWWRISAAAVLLLIAGFLWFNGRHGIDNGQEMANKPLPRLVEPRNSVTPDVEIRQDSNEITHVDLVIIKRKDKTTITEKKQEKSLVAHKVLPVKKKSLLADPTLLKNLVAAQSKKELDKQPAQNEETREENSVRLDIATADARARTAIQIQALRKQPDIEINPIRDYQTGAAVLADQETDENVVFANIPVDKKNSLRGIFRKATRFIDKNTSFRASKNSSLLVGNITIAFQ